MLKNGNLLVISEKSTGTQYYKNSFYEMDLTGKIYGEYLLESVHHEITEGNNGNFLALGNDMNGSVIEDTVYEIERNTGKILYAWDLDDILPMEAFDQDGNRVSSEVYGFNAHDWIHLNSVDQHPISNEILLSARNHDVVLSLAYPSGEINYIIGDHDVPVPDSLKNKLLTPISEEFQWSYGQHNAQFLENGDILIFDNGSYRSKTPENQVDSASAGYSRAVIYRVNQEAMTIEQVWEYGQELGSTHLATYLSGVQSLGENHFLINFGGQVFDEEGNPSYENTDGVKGHSASIQYEVKNREIIYASSFEISGVSGNMYRAERHNPYQTSLRSDLSVTASRYGSLSVRNIASSSAVPSENNLSLYSSSVVDNGVQLVCAFSIQDASSDDVASLVFVSVSDSYELILGKGAVITAYVTQTEIQQGTYDLYLKSGNKSTNLHLQWENTSVAVNPFENVHFVQANLSGSSGDSGNIEDSNDVYKLFSDVEKSDWFYSFVSFVTEKYTISPVSEGVFAPEQQATRAVVEALYRMVGSPGTEQTNPFSDVSESYQHKNAILWAVEQGIVVGVTETEFNPESPVTREQLAVILNQFISVQELVLPEVLEPKNYTDSDDIALWAKDSVDRMQVLWLMSGLEDGSFHPLGNTSRAEFAVVLFKLAGEEVVLSKGNTSQ